MKRKLLSMFLAAAIAMTPAASVLASESTPELSVMLLDDLGEGTPQDGSDSPEAAKEDDLMIVREEAANAETDAEAGEPEEVSGYDKPDATVEALISEDEPPVEAAGEGIIEEITKKEDDLVSVDEEAMESYLKLDSSEREMRVLDDLWVIDEEGTDAIINTAGSIFAAGSNERKAYDELKKQILAAEANGGSTMFSVTSVSYSAYTKIWKEVAQALIYDLGHYMYWFMGNYGVSRDGTNTYFYMSVSKEFRKNTGSESHIENDYGPEKHVLDPQKLSAAKTAFANAKSIVNKYASSRYTDYERILFYAKNIMDSVTYDFYAAEHINDNPETLNLQPWEIINVFDNNPNTNVVCEGYSKAIQYLCDISSFADKNVECIYVNGEAGGGGHAWNHIRMDDGKVYMLDLTWTDDDKTNYPYGYIFAPCSQSSYSTGKYTYDQMGIKRQSVRNYAYSGRTSLTSYSQNWFNMSDKSYVDNSITLSYDYSKGTAWEAGKAITPLEPVIKINGKSVNSANYDGTNISFKGKYFPGGITVDPKTGVISGTLTEEGYFDSYEVTAAIAGIECASVKLTINRDSVFNPSANPEKESESQETSIEEPEEESESEKEPEKTECEKNGHKPNYTKVVKATPTKDGYREGKCSVCGETIRTTILKVSNISLKKNTGTYSGKNLTPTVVVKNSKGTALKSSYYTVTVKNNKNVGTGTATVTLKGSYYSGSKTLTFKINPKGTTLSGLTAGSKSFTARIKKYTTQTTGYQIQYSTSSSFKSAKTVTISKNTTTSKAVKGLTAKKKYYVRVRTYKKIGTKTYYSAWSAAKSVTTKK